MFKKTSTLFLLALLLTQTSCSKKKQDLYKEGEIVTWSYGEKFIIKTKVGERRKHIVNTHCPRCERDFYRPQYEHYLGQFPIDYRPKKFTTMALEEARAIPLKNFHASYPALEFNLMLNGSWVQATDKGIDGEDALDHIDQVKVIVSPENIKYSILSLWEVYQANRQQEKRYDYSKYGLDCYFFENKGNLTCYGKSKSSNLHAVELQFFDERWIFGQSWREDVHGKIKVKWRFDSKNIQHWQEIDATIWQLLDAWNVSPILTHKED